MRQLLSFEPARNLDVFLASFRATLVVLSGRAAGMEYVLDQRIIRLGRGPGVDLAIDDPSLERVHARIEFKDGAFRVCSSAPEASLLLNGGAVQVSELKADDRFQLGEVSFTYGLEPRVLPDSAIR